MLFFLPFIVRVREDQGRGDFVKLFVLRLCRVVAAFCAVFICAMPMVLYAESYGDRIGGQESVLLRISGDEEEKHSKEVEVSVAATVVPSSAVEHSGKVTSIPTGEPDGVPTEGPDIVPSRAPEVVLSPTVLPTVLPTVVVVVIPTYKPEDPAGVPTNVPYPTDAVSGVPSRVPTEVPDKRPTKAPTPFPTIISSTTTILRPVVTSVPVYIPVVTSVPVSYLRATPVPIPSNVPVPTAVLPANGYTGGGGSTGLTVTGAPVREKEKEEEDGEVLKELVIVPMDEKQAGHEDKGMGLSVSEAEDESDETDDEEKEASGSGSSSGIFGSVVFEAKEDVVKEGEGGSFKGGFIRAGRILLIFLLVLGVVVLAFLLGLYMGWWNMPELPFFMGDKDEDDADEDGEDGEDNEDDENEDDSDVNDADEDDEDGANEVDEDDKEDEEGGEVTDAEKNDNEPEEIRKWDGEDGLRRSDRVR